jgi:hypothetical protein
MEQLYFLEQMIPLELDFLLVVVINNQDLQFYQNKPLMLLHLLLLLTVIHIMERMYFR